MVYTRNQIRDLRSRDPEVTKAIDTLERTNPLDPAFDRLYRVYVGSFDSLGDTADGHRSVLSAVKRFVSGHSKLWGMLRAVKRMLKPVGAATPDQAWNEILGKARKSHGLWIPFEKGRIRTILMPTYRLAALQIQDPRIREGLRVSIEAMKRMSMIAEKGGVRFTIAMIPTKELVFFDAFGSPAALSPVAQLASEEQKMRAEFRSEVCSRGISCIDLLPALRECLLGGESPYPIDADGHPNARGHKAIAAAVWSAVSAMERPRR